jgi:hypothetical protein
MVQVWLMVRIRVTLAAQLVSKGRVLAVKMVLMVLGLVRELVRELLVLRR